ncbi:hypothetical protein PTTG_00128 [Puccinia triticina 1-1 BBBD Race 1]|uniref:TP6A_N domain-containing protein n=1 Tax=Puccinia triticina (isolate 1-1 / race 1 (BBBD)) TaxID=630390 RepID=A0A180H331_PUCT1|nr:hypothetical protein PTTG_00128 [Puccinia triticina 1-1 BBBD Race 1]
MTALGSHLPSRIKNSLSSPHFPASPIPPSPISPQTEPVNTIMSDGQERRAESTPSPLEGDQFTNEAHTLSSIGQELFGFESPVSVSSDEVMTHSWYGDVSPSYSHGNNSDINKEEDEEKESVADDADPVVFNFGDARDQAALNKMENVVLGWLQRITFLQQSGLRESTGGRPGFDLGLPSVLFPTRRGQDCVGSTLKESKDIAKMFSIMSLSQGAILDQKILTYRDVLQSDAGLFESRAEVTRVVNDLAAKLELTCEELHVVGSVERFFPESGRLNIQQMKGVLSAYKIPFNDDDGSATLVPLYEALKKSKTGVTPAGENPKNGDSFLGKPGNSAVNSQPDGIQGRSISSQEASDLTTDKASEE